MKFFDLMSNERKRKLPDNYKVSNPCKQIRLSSFLRERVISYCLYSTISPINIWNCHSVKKFHTYLYGLKQNLKFCQKNLPGWTVYLYLSQDLQNDYEILHIIRDYQNIIKIKLFKQIYYGNEAHIHAFERYRVLWDTNVQLAVIRDIDQLLTLLDFSFIVAFELSNKRYLIYRETNMDLLAMGGGFTAKLTLRKKIGTEPVTHIHYGLAKNFDEFTNSMIDLLYGMGDYEYGCMSQDKTDVMYSRGFEEYCISIMARILGFGSESYNRKQYLQDSLYISDFENGSRRYQMIHFSRDHYRNFNRKRNTYLITTHSKKGRYRLNMFNTQSNYTLIQLNKIHRKRPYEIDININTLRNIWENKFGTSNNIMRDMSYDEYLFYIAMLRSTDSTLSSQAHK